MILLDFLILKITGIARKMTLICEDCIYINTEEYLIIKLL